LIKIKKRLLYKQFILLFIFMPEKVVTSKNCIMVKMIKSWNIYDGKQEDFMFSNTNEIISNQIYIDPNNQNIYHFITIKMN